MPEQALRDRYEESFSPREYLRQYYSLPELAKDDADLFRHLTGWLHRTGRVYDSALDIGCGPTIHNTFAIAPFARRITLADYLAGNLEEVRKWLDATSDAHDWDALFQGVLACEQARAAEVRAVLDERKQLYRSRVVSLLHCDLRQPHPLGTPEQFELVTSFFCAECVAGSTEEWRELMARVLALVAPGGAAFFAAIRDCWGYSVLGRWFPAVPIREIDFTDLFAAHGFVPSTVDAVAVPAPDWASSGFDHIVLAHGQKA